MLKKYTDDTKSTDMGRYEPRLFSCKFTLCVYLTLSWSICNAFLNIENNHNMYFCDGNLREVLIQWLYVNSAHVVNILENCWNNVLIWGKILMTILICIICMCVFSLKDSSSTRTWRTAGYCGTAPMWLWWRPYWSQDCASCPTVGDVLGRASTTHLWMLSQLAMVSSLIFDIHRYALIEKVEIAFFAVPAPISF